MRLSVLCLIGVAVLLACAGLAATAQEPKTTPKAGELIPSTFRSFLVTDGRYPPMDPRNRAGKVHCLVCENGLAPVVAIFVRSDPDSLAPDSGVANLIKKTNSLIPKYRADKLGAFVDFLRLEGGTKDVTVKTKQDDGSAIESKVQEDKEYPDEPLENREKAVESIRKFAEALNVPNIPFGLAADKSKAATQWGIDENKAVTVVVYYRMRQVGKYSFDNPADVSEAKTAEILKLIEDEINNSRR